MKRGWWAGPAPEDWGRHPLVELVRSCCTLAPPFHFPLPPLPSTCFSLNHSWESFSAEFSFLFLLTCLLFCKARFRYKLGEQMQFLTESYIFLGSIQRNCSVKGVGGTTKSWGAPIANLRGLEGHFELQFDGRQNVLIDSQKFWT